MSDGRDEELHADRSFRPGPPPELREPPPRRTRALGIFVATFALAAFAAVVWYAYDQGLQRGSEATAPLIKADPTPTKVRPEQPGGLQVPNQDKLVYEAMRPGEADGSKVERLLPPPEKPVEPPAAPPPASSPPPAPAAPAAVAAVPPPAPAGTESGIPPARIVTPAPTPRIPTPEPAAQTPTTQTPPAPAPVVEAKPEPAPPPPPAPAPAVEAKPAPAAAAPPPPPPAVAPAPKAAPGNFRIQVGALRDQAAAEAEWKRLQKRFPDELAGLEHRIQKVDLGPGKGVFFRIQSSGVTEAAAGAICTGLKAKEQPCIVVKP